MADYHILSADKYGNIFNVVMHFPVPDTTNQASVNYQTAILEWQGGAPITSVLPGIDVGEQAQLDAGTLYEKSITFHSHPGRTALENQSLLDAMWASTNTALQNELVLRLSYWGYERDIP